MEASMEASQSTLGTCEKAVSGGKKFHHHRGFGLGERCRN